MDAMASTTWHKNPSVEEALQAEPYSFDFDQAILILERMHAAKASLGEGCDPSFEAVTLKSHVSLAPPASELQQLDQTADKPTLWINFLSLAGALGPLPTPYTETVIQRTREKDTGFRDFLDIFNHRLASLWHRFHKKIYTGVAQILPHESNIGKCLLQLAGISHSRMIEGTDLNEMTLLTYQNLMWKQPHGTIGLGRLLHHHFDITVHIHDFQGAWRYAAPSDVSRIGVHQGQWNALGQTTLLGSKTWDQMAGIQIDIVDLSWERFCQFLPPADDMLVNDNRVSVNYFQQLKELCQLYVGLDFSISVKLSLHPDQIKPIILCCRSPAESAEGTGADYYPSYGNRLGLNTWLNQPGAIKGDVSAFIRL